MFLQLAEANVLILNTVTAEDESSECFTDKQHCFFQPILRQKLTTFWYMPLKNAEGDKR